MKKIKPNLWKMFNFHTIILLVAMVVVVSTLHTHPVEGKLQKNHKHQHSHNHHNKNNNNNEHYNVAGVGGDGALLVDTDDITADDKKHQQQQHKHGHHHHHHHHSHHHHHHQQLQLQHHGAAAVASATPSLEFTTSSSSSSSSSSSTSSSSSSFTSSSPSASTNGDNEFLIKQEPQEQEEPPLAYNQDEKIYYKTKDLKSLTSSTSKPSLSIHLRKHQSQHARNNMKTTSSSNSIIIQPSETLSNSRREEHTQFNNYNSNRLISTPLTAKHHQHQHQDSNSNSGIDIANNNINNNRSRNVATMLSESPNENDKLNLATKHKLNEQQQHYRGSSASSLSNYEQQQPPRKPDFVSSPQSQHNYDDFYNDQEEEDDDEDDHDANDEDDDEDDDEYNEDIDGMSYDGDNNLSDRSYARITRSKLDDDYIDDEPYRGGMNDLSMQRDAAPGILTEKKYMEVGNEKLVQQARERYIQEKRPRTPHELASEHWHRMIQATKCRKPMPRVIPISNNTSKRYEPYATILHRCGDDTGCCGSTASVCTVKRHEIVMVYVFSYDFNYRKEIEALPMQNHTECHCVNRGSLLHDSMPRDKRSGGSGSAGGLGYWHHFQRQQRKQQPYHQSQQQSPPPLPLPQQQQQQQAQLLSHSEQQFHHHEQQLQNMLDCHCPRHFNVFEEEVERHAHLPKPHSVSIRKCHCDCLANNQTCLRFKHGEEGFSLEDRKCILERNCKTPICSYGEYNLRIGRCPSSSRSHHLQTNT